MNENTLQFFNPFLVLHWEGGGAVGLWKSRKSIYQIFKIIYIYIDILYSKNI